MKKACFFAVGVFFCASMFGQKNSGDTITPTFYKIRNEDFSKLISAATPGISVSFNQDKSTLSGSFNLSSQSKKDADKNPWFVQLLPSIGTTSTLFEFGQDAPQFDFSTSLQLTGLFKSLYRYDDAFRKGYSTIVNPKTVGGFKSGVGYSLSNSFIENLRGAKPRLSAKDTLYTTKHLFWGAFKVDAGTATYTFYDRSRAFSDQLYKPRYTTWGLGFNLNYYYYRNNDGLKWRKLPVRFFYVNAGIRYGINNNVDGLKKASINDIAYSDTLNGTVRQSIKTTTAYKGAYQEFTAVTPSFEILYSFIKLFAINVFGSYNLPTDGSNNKDGKIAVGLYFITAEDASKLNIGVYYQHSLGVPVSKEIIGIKTKIPINVW